MTSAVSRRPDHTRVNDKRWAMKRQWTSSTIAVSSYAETSQERRTYVWPVHSFCLRCREIPVIESFLQEERSDWISSESDMHITIYWSGATSLENRCVLCTKVCKYVCSQSILSHLSSPGSSFSSMCSSTTNLFASCIDFKLKGVYTYVVTGIAKVSTHSSIVLSIKLPYLPQEPLSVSRMLPTAHASSTAVHA